MTDAHDDAFWDGEWRGEFGARSDIAILVISGRVASASILGNELPIARSELDGKSGTLTGPDGSIDLVRLSPSTAQAVYVSNSGKKATALLTRGP